MLYFWYQKAPVVVHRCLSIPSGWLRGLACRMSILQGIVKVA